MPDIPQKEAWVKNRHLEESDSVIISNPDEIDTEIHNRLTPW